jgi:thioredoxin-related protein
MMKPLIYLLILFAILITPVNAAADDKGILTGGQVYNLPDWFKHGFLEFDLEVSDAKESGKQVIAFLHLDECPYCVRMLDENFRSGETRALLENNFHVVGVDIKGSLDVTWVDGRIYTESGLSKHLRVYGTPAVVFLDQAGNNVLQLNGYRDPAAFRQALNYVQERHYQTTKFVDYLSKLDRQPVYQFASHRLLQKATYFKDYNQALVILFEDGYCGECTRFHEKTLNHADVLAALEDVLFVRLDTESTQRIVNLEGKMMTAHQWMVELGLTFRPSLVMFNAGRELFRADGIKYHHHLSEGLVYVKSGYLEYPVPGDFKKAYRARLMDKGMNVDFSE